MRATICALSSALILIAGATPAPASAAIPSGSGSFTFSVGTLSCANASARVNLSSVSVSVLYLNTSNSFLNSTNDSETDSYTWDAGTNYTVDTGLSGAVSILLDATTPSECPWAGNSWLNWTNVSDGSALAVAITFAPGNGGMGNGSWTPGNSTVTVSPPAPSFLYFLEVAGLGIFCVFLYWSLKGWQRIASLVTGDAS